MTKYITKQGDTWDSIAFSLFGNEYLFPELLKVNQKYKEYVIFPAGVEIIVPIIDMEQTEAPPWVVDSEDIDFTEDDEEVEEIVAAENEH